MANRIEMRLDQILDEVTMLLHENRLMVLAIAHALETHKTILGDDVARSLNLARVPRSTAVTITTRRSSRSPTGTTTRRLPPIA